MADIGAPRRMLIVRERETVLRAVLEPVGDDGDTTATPAGAPATPLVAERVTDRRDATSSV